MHKHLIRLAKKKIFKNIRETTIANEIEKLIRKDNIKNNKIKILDFGCGKIPLVSMHLSKLLEKNFRVKIYLFDTLNILNPYKKKEKNNKKKGGGGGEFITISKLNFKNNFFDYIIINDVIHHFEKYENKKKLKENLNNIFKKGKKIIIKDHFQNNKFDNLLLKIMDRISNLNKVHFPNIYFSKKSFVNLIKSLNYNIIYMKNISIYNLIYPFSKKSLQFFRFTKQIN